MTDQTPQFIVQGLTALQADELSSELTRAGGDVSTLDLQPDSKGVAGSRSGEPFTVIVTLALSQIAVTALTAYIAKSRNRTKSKLSIRQFAPDGAVKVVELEVDARNEEALRADLLKQLGALQIKLPHP